MTVVVRLVRTVPLNYASEMAEIFVQLSLLPGHLQSNFVRPRCCAFFSSRLLSLGTIAPDNRQFGFLLFNVKI